jgi:hypothetical protein
LYFWPQIDWHLAEEIIVIYTPSDPVRFDYINDEFSEHGQFNCMWPWWEDKEDGPRKFLWRGYNEAAYSEKFAILEQIGHVIELQNWCKVHNAELVITSAFDRSYNREKMYTVLQDVVRRGHEQKLETFMSRDSGPTEQYIRENYPTGHLEFLEQVVDMWPWDKMFNPQGCDTFMDLCLKQEGISNKGFWDYNGVGTPGGWVTVCCHPSAKGHDLFAKELHRHLTK